MKILVIGGSNSKNSINRTFANYVASFFKTASKELIDISKMDLPIYSVDTEKEIGIHSIALEFAAKIDNTGFIIISLAENNGSFNVGLKNLLDWTSRIKGRKIFNRKPMLLMATSPGARGGLTVLESAKSLFPRYGADIKASFSLPEYNKNFDVEKGITNPELLEHLEEIVTDLQNAD